MIWLAILAEIVLLILALWVCCIVFKLYFVKGYSNYPPFVPTLGNVKKEEFLRLSSILKKTPKPLKILDPGCGTASLIAKLAKDFPQHSFVGIEWNKSLYKIAKFRNRNLPNVNILCQNMFDYSFKDIDIIVCFLMEPLMKRFGEKIKKEGKQGLVVYSNTFSIPNIPLYEKIKTKKFLVFGNLYVYKL